MTYPTLPETSTEERERLILEHLQDIPEPNTSVRIAGHALEIVQTQDRVIKSVRVYAPTRP